MSSLLEVTGDADDGVVVQTLFETMKERAEGTDSLATALFQLKDRVEALESRQTSFNSNSTLGWKQCEIQPLNNGCENCQIASCPFKVEIKSRMWGEQDCMTACSIDTPHNLENTLRFVSQDFLVWNSASNRKFRVCLFSNRSSVSFVSVLSKSELTGSILFICCRLCTTIVRKWLPSILGLENRRC